MKIRQILESVSVGGMGTGSIATAPAKAGKMIKRQKGNLLAQEDQGIEEVSLGNYREKAGKGKALAGMGAMFAPDPEQRAKELATFKKRERGLERVKARDEKARAADQQRQMADLVARLPELEAEYAAMQKRYKALGGSNWQYADREQNLSDAEREARSMEGPMNNLWRQIQAAKKHQGVAEGLGKSIKRSIAGWGAFDKDKPKDVVNKVKGQDTDVLKRLHEPNTKKGKGSPAELQQKAISRELRKRGQGVAEGSDDLVQIEYWQQDTMESGRWVRTKPMPRDRAEKIVGSFERGEIVDAEQGVAEGESKKPHPKTWHDVDTKLGKQVDKMTQAEKVKKGLAHPDTLKKKELEEYGDTAKGQKMLTKVQKRAVDRMIKAADKGDAKTAGKNQDTANRAWDRMTDKDLEENKKGVRAVKHTAKPKGIEPPKPRNFVAKNAKMGGAGQHKDKKKAAKQGDVKHKAKEPAYESRLWAALERKIGK